MDSSSTFRQSSTTSPAAIVAHLEQQARRHETPCGAGTLVWRAWGSGPPLILFHGSDGSWLHWVRNIEALAAHYTVWAVDLPGFGDSALPPEATHEAIAHVLADGIRQLLGTQLPVSIVGFSFGGLMGGHLAALHPDLVRELILIDTGGLGTPGGHFQLQRLKDLQGEARRQAARANLLAIMIHGEDSADDLALHVAATNVPKSRLRIMTLVLPDKLLPALPRIQCPLAAIWGEFDHLHPDPPVQEAVLRQFQPNLVFRVLAGAGHWAMYERAEDFNRTVLELLPLRR